VLIKFTFVVVNSSITFVGLIGLFISESLFLGVPLV
jgi:hypothetical protein